MGLRVRDVLSDRKYQGGYERVAELLRYLRLPSPARFFEQLAFSVMVRNGDALEELWGAVPGSPVMPGSRRCLTWSRPRIYPYARYPGGPELEDRTLALKFFAGRHGSHWTKYRGAAARG